MTIDQALERLVLDVEFRTRLLQDVDGALAGYELSEADRDRLLQHAEMLEGGVEEEGAMTEEIDSDQADAARAKA